jgi:hypothetical protein|tara:strand:- start:364 stop:633 length:270 start_codon:yes stop_codon:yes gene_type:complete
MQALLQQPDQVILCRALRLERCSVSVSSVSSAFRFCAPAPGVAGAGAARADPEMRGNISHIGPVTMKCVIMMWTRYGYYATEPPLLSRA